MLAASPPFCLASSQAAVSNGSSTGMGLRRMPVKTSDVMALSCISAGIERGSDAA
ncbi:hypothetical protein ES703_85763 [subsurface metagenome]